MDHANKSEHDADANEAETGSVGCAWIEADGTIYMRLTYIGAGMSADAEVNYPRDHPDYDRILEHIGGLKVGEMKNVRPWPDS